MSPTSRGRPPRLDHGRTVETALRLLDESGLEALTMRRLADAMDVQAGALYRYFATKQDLLTAMAERILAGVTPPPAGPWTERLTGLARATRTALLSHRDGARVYAGTHSTGPNTLGLADAFIGVLRDAGFSSDDAARATMTVIDFTTGHTLEEQAVLRPNPENPADPERLRQAVTPQRFPHLAAAVSVLTSTDFAARFEFGLHVLVAGLSTANRGTGDNTGAR
ncbi:MULTISPECIES: TetR/AcrR family transcriptional regulator [Actinomadura]|uniref:TetR/AcrR family transcriptional regulator n=1 Tax=Actinomadura yumaensis TaxID=111807 RepID=A0ABW2CPE5_9ACTN|nr:TetR/AcrR family transcriptional regulator [Actinomadura sp. J1-007]